MVPRYARPAMTAIWEPEARYKIWFEIEAHATTKLAELGVAQEPAVAAAVDEQVVPRSRWSAHVLAEGARILVIRAAQGG